MRGTLDSYSRRTILGAIGAAGAALTTAGGSAAASANGGVTVHEDITYARRPEGELKLDLYLPPTKSPSPLVVWIHGGGWLVNTRKTSPDLARYFASQGYAMATISHRLSAIPAGIDPVIEPDPDNPTPRGTFPDHIVDVKAAIRWLRAHADEYGLEPDAVAVWGSSSGAHLASLAGTVADVEEIAGDVYPPEAVAKEVHPEQSGRVQAVVPWYPPTDFLMMDPQLEGEGFPHNAPNSPESLLIGGQITAYQDRVERANPITYVTPDDPPFLIMHGREDTTVPYGQSRLLFYALRRACVETTLYELHGLGHGFGFEELAGTPASEQTVHRVDGETCEMRTETPAGQPAGPAAVRRFFDRHLGR